MHRGPLRRSQRAATVTDLYPGSDAAASAHAQYLRADLTDCDQTLDVVGAVKPDVDVHATGIPMPNDVPRPVIFFNNVVSMFAICE